MKIRDFNETVKNLFGELQESYNLLGVRFEDADRQIGDVCDRSKDNPDREDIRDFPAYGTDEYDELPSLDGTCAWDLDNFNYSDQLDREASAVHYTHHAYIIAGKYKGNTNNYAPDDGEILIQDAVVVAKLF